MHTIKAIGLVLALSLVGLTVVSAADISGKWDFAVTFTNANGQDTHTFVFKQEGEVLTGTGTGALTKIESVKGTVKGDRIAFTVTGLNIRGERLSIDYAGTIVSATKMVGTLDYHKGKPDEFTATKKP